MSEYRVLHNFKAKVNGGVIEFISGQVLKLERSQAEKLLQLDKIEPLDEHTAAFDQAAQRLSKQYKPGALEHCQKHYQEMYNKTIEVENRLNAIWNKGADPAEFKQALNEWESIHTELLKLFKR